MHFYIFHWNESLIYAWYVIANSNYVQEGEDRLQLKIFLQMVHFLKEDVETSIFSLSEMPGR